MHSHLPIRESNTGIDVAKAKVLAFTQDIAHDNHLPEAGIVPQERIQELQDHTADSKLV